MAVVKKPTCNTAAVTNLIQAHVAGARLSSDISAELSYILPHESKAHFSQLFTELDRQKETLGIVSYGASVTTMDEVFIRVGEQVEEDMMSNGSAASRPALQIAAAGASDAEQLESDSDTTDMLVDGPHATSLSSATQFVCVMNRGTDLFMQQFYGMLVKRVTNTVRSWLLTLSQLVVPVFFTVMALAVIQTLPLPGESPPLKLDLSRLPNSVVAYSSGPNATGNRLADAYASYLHDHFSSIQLAYVNNISGYKTDPDILRYLESEGKRSMATYNNRYSIACEMSDSINVMDNKTSAKATILFNNQGYHAAAISLNTFANALLQQVSGLRNMSLLAVNHPMPRTANDMVNDQMAQAFEGFAISVNLQFGMSFLAASFALFLIREHSVKSKHCQFVSGAGSVTFWSAAFIWDVVNYLLACAGVLIAFAAFDVEAYVGVNRAGYILLLMLLYAWAILPFMYLFSFLFSVPSSGLVWLTIFNILSGIGTLLAVTILSIQQLGTQSIAKALEWVFMILFPNFSLGQSVSDLYSNYMFLNACQPYLASCELLCLLKRTIPCCKDCCGDQCFDFNENYLSYEPGGIGRHLTFLGAQGLLYFVILLLVESRLLRQFWFKLRRHWSPPPVVYVDVDEISTVWEDEDVAFERQRIVETPLNDLLRTDSIVVKELSRVYGAGGGRGMVVAVDKLSFRVQRGECFGLLGVNGAGKTTTFQMLTGDIFPTDGDAYINGLSVVHDIRQVQSCLGYCPQFDALLDLMTGSETLYMFARLRGISEHCIEATVQRLVSDLLLQPYANQLVASYSGGNKRKLSTAVALIGDAPVVFLDEPSTGLDPVARRHLWNTLSRVCASGRTLILTSHSMEECDALCTRIAIMVNGKLKCLGSPQHLKSKFGDGYTLIAKVASHTPGVDVDVVPLCEHVERLFPGCALKDVHHGLVQYHIPRSPTLSLADLFSAMEEVRDQFSVEDYSVSQTTLEQVFINFARNQQPPSNVQHAGCCRAICCCLGC